MTTEIVYVCNSINNKNIRGNELEILRKIEEELCFEFGESENNIKKRFYRSIEALNKDFEEVTKIKEKLERQKVVVEEDKKEETVEVTSGYNEVLEPIEQPRTETFKRKRGKRTF